MGGQVVAPGAYIKLPVARSADFERVDQQHRDGHRSHAAGHRRDVAGHLAHAGEVDVAAQLAFVVVVHADVDHDGAGLDHVGREHIAPPDGGHHHVGLQRVRASGRRWRCGRSVTVAFCCSSISAMGLPTVLLRPMTTACLPRSETPVDSIIFMQP
jgi:hypothetical protein